MSCCLHTFVALCTSNRRMNPSRFNQSLYLETEILRVFHSVFPFNKDEAILDKYTRRHIVYIVVMNVLVMILNTLNTELLANQLIQIFPKAKY